DRVQVKKVFHLDSADVDSAELFLYGTAKTVTVNGKTVAEVKRLESTGWSRVAIPVEALRPGANELVLKVGGQVLLEPGPPGRRLKSSDGGETPAGRQRGRDNQLDRED